MTVKTIAALGMYKLLDITEAWLWSHLPLGGLLTSSNIFLTTAGLSLIAALLNLPVSSDTKTTKGHGYLTRYLPLCLPILVAAMVLSLPPTASPPFPYTRAAASSKSLSTPSSPGTIRVLDRAHSTTGLILVGEHVEEQFRFMRADHSLLGGRWVGKRVAPGTDGLGDSIYSTFVLQEAVRLAKRNSTGTERALFIGLGVGIAAESFISQGIHTTIVEIDPVVYKYAKEYFSLPEPQAVHLQDARSWVEGHFVLPRDLKYDYVIHDCFSGGGVPQHLFTVEFWESLKSIMKPDGVLAVNFAGKVATDPVRAIYKTLEQTFGRCTAYHDHREAEFDETYTFFNIVFFCMTYSTTGPVFRSAMPADYHGSYLRRHVLSGLPKRQLDLDHLLGSDKDPKILEDEDKWILRDGYNPLAQWEQADSVEHWSVMRDVLPDIFWETY